MAENVKYILEVRDKFSKNLKKMRKALKEVDSSTKKLGLSMKKIGQTMTNKLTKPIAAMAIVAGITFARLSKGLQNTLGLLTGDEVAQFGSALELAQQEALAMGFSIADTNEALFNTVSALGAGEASIKAFQIAQKLSIAGNASLSTSVDGITSIVNAYGRELTDALDVANALFTAQVKGKTTVALLAANVGKVAPIAKQAGVGFKELLATLSALTLGGISTDEAATALKGAISALVAPSDGAAKVLKKLGIPFGTTQIRAAGLANTIKKLNEASKKYPDLLSKAIPNIRAFTAVTALSEDKLKILDDTIKQIQADIKNGTGLNEKYADQMMELSVVFGQAKGEITLVSREIGAILAPAILKVLNMVIDLAKGFRDLSPGMKTTIVVITGILAVAGPFLIFIGALTIAIAALATAAGALGIAFLPITAIVVGIGAAIGVVVGLIHLLNKAFDSFAFRKVRKFFSRAVRGGRVGTAGTINPQNEQVIGAAERQRPNNQNFNIGGELTVRALPGTEINAAKMYNPDLGVNMIGALNSAN